MKWINVFVTISIFLYSFGLEGNAQESVMHKTDSIEQKVLLLEKEIYNARNENIKQQLILKKANIFKDAGYTYDAIKTFSRVPYTIANERVAFEALYNLALLYYSQDKFETAAQHLSYMESYTPDYVDKPKVLFLGVLINNVMEEFKIARQNLKQYAQCCKNDLNVDSVYQGIDEMKNPEKAKQLSAYLPGLGQFYAGKPWKGINSFLLNAGFLGYTAYSIYTKMYVIAIFSGLEFLVAFYNGGKRNAQSIVQRANAKTIEDLNRFLIDWSESCNH
ncbi:MAG: hypothetical protein ACOCPM_01085 [Bacteroidales bacterium]